MMDAIQRAVPVPQAEVIMHGASGRLDPDGLAVFTLPEGHRRRLRTSNPMERAIQQEIKRRTQKVRVFPNEKSLERLVSAVLVEIDDKWASADKAYIKWECQDD